MKSKFLEIAKLTRPQGLKGEMRAVTYCDDPLEVGDFDTLFMGKDKTPVSPEYVREGKGFIVIKLKGVDTIEAAEKLVNRTLYSDREDIELPEDVHFIADIIGLPVYDEDSGRCYGKVTDILQYSPTDVYVVRDDEGHERLFPAIPEVLISLDVEGGRISIRPLDGLFEE